MLSDTSTNPMCLGQSTADCGLVEAQYPLLHTEADLQTGPQNNSRKPINVTQRSHYTAVKPDP